MTPEQRRLVEEWLRLRNLTHTVRGDTYAPAVAALLTAHNAAEAEVAAVTVEAFEWRDRCLQAEAEVARLDAMRTHCEHCGADYLATGIEAGCPCRLVAEVARLRAALGSIARSSCCGGCQEAALVARAALAAREGV